MSHRVLEIRGTGQHRSSTVKVPKFRNSLLSEKSKSAINAFHWYKTDCEIRDVIYENFGTSEATATEQLMILFTKG